MFIYLIVNHATGKYYVGQHKGNNLKKYLQTKISDATHNRGGSSHLYASMRKHSKEVWSVHALLSDVQTRAELDQHERDFIAFLKSQDPEYGYNICRGGEGFSGPHREESKQKQRLAILGRTHTPEAIAKMQSIPRTPEQLANLNRDGYSNISEETRAKIKVRSEKQKEVWREMVATKHHDGQRVGFRHSDEAKAKISVAKKGKPGHPLSAETKNKLRIIAKLRIEQQREEVC